MANTQKYYSLRSYYRFARIYKWRFIFTILSFSIANIFLALIPVFIGALVGDLAARPVLKHQAVIATGILIGLSVAHDITWRLSEFIFARLVLPISFKYQNLVFRLVIRRPYPYFIDKFTGKISSYVTTLGREQKDLFETICYNYTSQVVSLIAVFIILANVNWETALIFAVGLLGMYIAGKYTITSSAKYEKLFTDKQATTSARIIDSVANFVNVKSFKTEDSEISISEASQAETAKAATKSQVWSQVFWGTMSIFVREMIWPATIAVNVILFLKGDITIGQLTVVLSTILIFTSTIWELVWSLSQFNLRRARMEEAHRYLFGDKIVTINDEYVPTLRTPLFGKSIEIKDLDFAYPDKPDEKVLSALNLRIQKGEKVGVVGKSGSGKSTLTKLLLAYYDLPEGHLLIDGKMVEANVISRLMSFVPQDTSLFHRSIADNIAYASNKATSREEIIDAAKKAHADEFIRKLQEGYDSLVGERGVKLSVGQRQRVAIARALLDDKPILILDEATSALDSESEILVQEALENLWKNKTVIAIAHRLSTLRNMDRIIVMEDGRIVEDGTHNELIAARGVYAKLWEHQSGGFISEN